MSGPPHEIDARLLVLRYGPQGTHAGVKFNVQPTTNMSAMWFEVSAATVTSVVVFDGSEVRTVIGENGIVSADLPSRLYAKPGSYEVYLRDKTSGRRGPSVAFFVTADDARSTPSSPSPPSATLDRGISIAKHASGIHPLEVPESLHRNSPGMAVAGYENTGQMLIDLATRAVCLSDLAGIDVLDVGCGVRFTMTIINRGIPIKSYTGIETHKPIVDFLKANVEDHDARFKFFHWNVHNELYNPTGIPLHGRSRLPVAGHFDLIWLFSVFTHLNPPDSLALLTILKEHIREDGKLFFSAFIDDHIDAFEDRIKDKPLLQAYYSSECMTSLIQRSGWRIDGAYEKDLTKYIQHYFVCSPSK